MTSRRTHRCSAGASGQWRVAVQCQRLPYVVESRGAVLVVPMTRSVGGPGGRRVGGQVARWGVLEADNWIPRSVGEPLRERRGDLGKGG